MLLAPSVSRAGDVIVEASLDSMMMWIGQQTGLHLGVTCDSGQLVEFPLFSDTVVSGLEIIPPVRTDTVLLNRGERMTVTRHYTVTSFDSALYYIAPVEVKVDGQPHLSNRLALAFMTYEIPEENASDIYGPKENMNTPVIFREVIMPVTFLIISLIALTVMFFLLRRYKDNKPIIRRIKVEPKLPAHTRALEGIERLRSEGRAHDDDPKEYYTQLTDIVRQYINERFGFNATEMTSDEILEHLNESRDKESLKELSELLTTADMVKFAKMRPMLGENDRNLLSAVEFVKDTLLEQPAGDMQPKEETVVIEKRSKKARITLLVSVIVLACVAADLLGSALFLLYLVLF